MQTEVQPGIICIGTSLVDLNFRLIAKPQLHTSNPADLFRSPGGVIRNIAHHLALLHNRVDLITLFGDDPDGKWLMDICSDAGIGIKHAEICQEPTGTYASVLSPEGELTIGAAAAAINEKLDIAFLASRSSVIQSASMVIADCNLSREALQWLISFCDSYNLPIVIETVSVAKSQRLNKALPGNVLMVKPNLEEIEVFGSADGLTLSLEDRISRLHQNGIRYVWLSKAEEGSILSDGTRHWTLNAPEVIVKDTTGAGDAATAGWVHGYLEGKDPFTCMRYGHAAAAAILEAEGAVRNDLTTELLHSYLTK
jgi:pseudouridine kinase